MGCWSFLLPALCLLIIGTTSTDTNTDSGCEPLVSALAVMTVKIAKMETEIEEKNEELMKKDRENQQLLDKLAILENHSISAHTSPAPGTYAIITEAMGFTKYC